MAQACVLVIPGNPVPQPRARVSTRGGFARAYVPAKHPIHAYRAAIEAKARETAAAFTGPVRLEVDAVFERPASHWRKAGLRDDAPSWPNADGDNIAKGVADALTGAGVWKDDACVVEWRIKKRFGVRGERGSTTVSISEAAPPCH